jgi:hypothetical protein
MALSDFGCDDLTDLSAAIPGQNAGKSCGLVLRISNRCNLFKLKKLMAAIT